MVSLLRQSVYSRLVGYEDNNDAERLAEGPAMRVVVGGRGPDRPAASASAMSRFVANQMGLAKAARHWSLRSVQVKLIEMGGRLVRHARRLIFHLSEVSVPGRLFPGVMESHRSVIASARLGERKTTILLRGRVLQEVALSSERLHPIYGNPMTIKTDNECGSGRQSFSLSAGPGVARFCTTWQWAMMVPSRLGC